MSGAARLLAALALLVALCAGRKVDSSIETQYPFPVLTDKFGFEEDSFLSISLDYTPPSVPLRFLMCSEADLTRLQYATITGLCMNASLIPCYLNAPMTGGAFRLNLTNIAPERYEFILANCEAAHIAVQIDMLFLNADGEHLSTHEQPLVYIRALSIGLWALLALAWLGHWALSDVRPPALHHVLSSVPLLKLLALAASLGSWLHLSAHGHVPDWLQVCNYLFTFLFNVAFYSAVLLVSRGWTITVLSVPGQELRAYGVTVLGLALSSLFYELLGRYYFFALLVMGVIYLRFALANVQTNIQELKHALRIIRQHPGTTLELLLRTKCTAMKRFNRLLVGYAFGMGGALVLVTFFFGSVTWVDSNKDWLVLLLLEAMLLLFFAGTAFLFRLRRIYPVQQPGAPVPLKNSAEDPAVVAVVPPYGRYTTLLAVREDAVGSLLG